MNINADRWSILLRSDREFLSDVVANITGWLDPYAALRTIDLLNHQENQDIKGSLLEIGIFKGKYFSLLVRSAARTSECVVGLDTFDYVDKNTFQEQFAQRFSPDSLAAVAPSGLNLKLVESASSSMSATSLRQILASEARFISIDGSHEYDDVMLDLRLADDILGPGGIIAADDYLNPISLGVTAAIDRFIDTNHTIVPFAYVSNKLFLCRSAWADRYRSVLHDAILADNGTEEPKSAAYQNNFNAGAWRNIEARYRGFRILTVRL
ncbi:MAG: class I SAM-dependent methyltransferase [Alphaproteobacteria bacterium]|nr:MAG: class I SAM-dependent methyltransferase [Alphaproteobacteria bacterium]